MPRAEQFNHEPQKTPEEQEACRRLNQQVEELYRQGHPIDASIEWWKHADEICGPKPKPGQEQKVPEKQK